AGVDVERGLPQLLWIHLPEAFVALEREAFAPSRHHRVEQLARPMHDEARVLALEHRRPGIDLLQMRSETVELERIRRGDERPVDQMRFHDASELAPEPQPAFGQGLAMPTSLGFLREGIEALGDIGRSGLRLLRILEHFGAKRTGDRRLLNNEARIAAVQAFEDR